MGLKEIKTWDEELGVGQGTFKMESMTFLR